MVQFKAEGEKKYNNIPNDIVYVYVPYMLENSDFDGM